MEQNFTDFNRHFFKRTATKARTEIKATPVILICIYNHNNTLITHDLIYNVFSKYGKVLRILMFEKVKVWKAFVEYSTLESAYEAKRRLDDYVLFNDGTRLNVYFSNLETIKFQNNNSGGVDYTLQEETETCDTSQNFHSPPRLPSGLLPRNELPRMNEPIMKNNAFPNEILRQDYPISPPYNDEKGEEEILKMINDQQHQDKEFFPREDNQNITPDHPEPEPDNAGFNPYFLKAFEPQPPQQVITQPQIFPKQNTPSRTYEDSEGFQRPVIVRHQGHKHTAPPGLAIYQNNRASGGFIPNNPEKRVMLPSPGSFNNLPSNYGQNNNNILRPNSIQEIPRNILNTTAPQFEPVQRMRPSNFSTFSPHREQSSPNKVPQQNFSMHVRMGSEGTSSYDANEASPDSFSYHSLFDMIERDIAADMTSKMKNMDINSGHPQMYNQPQDVNTGMGFGYQTEQQYSNQMGNGNMQMHSVHTFSDNNEDRQSQVLFVQGLEDPNITIHMVYNLFGNFGNILKVIFLRTKAAALLEYENIDYATIAKDYLNNIILFGKPLRIFFSNMAIVNMKLKKINKDSGEEVLIGNPKTFRFKKNKNISINPPSATLHLSNLVQEVCNEEAITRFFGPYGTVLAMQPIVKEGKYMCLMKLGSIEESINIMAILNDAEFGGGKRVQLSFTRSKI